MKSFCMRGVGMALAAALLLAVSAALLARTATQPGTWGAR